MKPLYYSHWRYQKPVTGLTAFKVISEAHSIATIDNVDAHNAGLLLCGLVYHHCITAQGCHTNKSDCWVRYDMQWGIAALLTCNFHISLSQSPRPLYLTLKHQLMQWYMGWLFVYTYEVGIISLYMVFPVLYYIKFMIML